MNSMLLFEMNDRKKIGLGLTGFGIFFSFLGIIFFFDKGFLAMGNILFISGVSLTIGLKSTMQFFMKRQNYKGTISFGVGFFLVVIGWPVIGMILESYGFIVLFSGFWPTLAVFLQKIPILGWVFQQPYIRSVISKALDARLTSKALVWVLICCLLTISSWYAIVYDPYGNKYVSFEYKSGMDSGRNASSSDRESQFSAQEDEDDTHPNLLRRMGIQQYCIIDFSWTGFQLHDGVAQEFVSEQLLTSFRAFQHTVIPLQHLVSFGLNLVSRSFEFQADAFAQKSAGFEFRNVRYVQ